MNCGGFGNLSPRFFRRKKAQVDGERSIFNSNPVGDVLNNEALLIRCQVRPAGVEVFAFRSDFLTGDLLDRVGIQFALEAGDFAFELFKAVIKGLVLPPKPFLGNLPREL